jgi:uncharacterized Zn finger protein
VAATHYVLGEALDRDPFLLFELRGRTKEQVLAGLNQLRAQSGATDAGAIATVTEVIPTSHVMTLSDLQPQHFESGATLPVMSFNFDSAPAAGALLRSLGKPSSWHVHESPQEVFGPALQHARQLAIELATGTGALPAIRNVVNKPDSKATQVRKAGIKRKNP